MILFDCDFFIFEMANNHQGSVGHGKRIVDLCVDLVKEYNLPCAGIKIQLRNLKTFIHPKVKNKNTGHVQRFRSTELSYEQFDEILTYAKVKGLKTVATIFDEDSIEIFKKLEVDYLKIASCSIDDYPLLDKLSQLPHQTILSTGGASLEKINRAINRLGKNSSQLALMHCVAMYPCDNQNLLLDHIKQLNSVFKPFQLGFSTHEHPTSRLPIAMAVTSGATIFEKHVAVETKEIKRNSYSANHQELRIWLETYQEAKSIANSDPKHFEDIRRKEAESLALLKRGVFWDSNHKSFFAFPKDAEGEEVSDVSTLYLSSYEEEERIILSQFDSSSLALREAGLSINEAYEVVFSFHKGIKNFNHIGAIYFNLFEDKYFLKKWIILFKDQKIPLHSHNDRKELLRVIKGECYCSHGDGESVLYREGESFTFKENEIHSLKGNTDVLILEEVVSKNNQKLGVSIYQDDSIIVSEDKRKRAYKLNEGLLIYGEK